MKLSECKGDWALVTGASSGIGAEFCRQLANKRINLVMVARRKELLEELSQDLIHQFGIKSLVLTFDLSEPKSALLIKQSTVKEGIKIRLLINNAGFGPWGSFDKTSFESYEKIVQLNAATPISLCNIFLSDLESFSYSAIINVSSPSALQPVPYLAVYSATKACLHQFSLALYGELQNKNIHVQTLLPGPTATEFDSKACAYASSLGQKRNSPMIVVKTSLHQLDKKTPMVTTNKGTYKQRLFAGIAPIKMVVNEVKKMFAPPLGR